MKKKNQTYQAENDFDSFDSMPSSGSAFDAMSGDDFSGSAFEESNSYPAPAARGRSGGSRRWIPVLAAVLVLAIAAAAFFLIPKKETEESPLKGAAAPAGKTEFISPGCEMILNELLVTADSGLTQKQMEEELLKLDAGIVGYLPELNQYQIRFNTDTKKALDEKRQAMESIAGVKRADYNYLLMLSADPATVRSLNLQAAPKGKLGLLGGVPATASADHYLLSPADDRVSAENLPDWLSGHRDSISPRYRADQAAALLNQSGSHPFATCFYFETNPDGSISGYTTTCALRYQLFRLVDAGAETIAFPFAGPETEDGLIAENELNELFFQALEKDHPSFMICKAWKKNDFLITMLAGTETGKRHLMTVTSCGDTPVHALDAAGAGKPAFLCTGKTAGADIAARGDNAEESVMMAAAELAAVRADRTLSDPAALKNELLAACGVLAACDDGTVIPGFDPNMPGNDSGEAYRLLMLTARDSGTGEIIPNVTCQADAGRGAVSETVPSGQMVFLLPSGPAAITVGADSYQQTTYESVPGQEREDIVYLTSTRAAGTVTGKVLLHGNGILEDLHIRFRNTRTGEEGVEMPLTAEYRMAVQPGEYDLIISGRNRTAVTVYGVQVTEGAETAVPAVTLAVSSDLPGTGSGMIKDAMTGGALEGVELTLFEGADAPASGQPAVTTVSDSNGNYSVTLPGGVYTAYLSKTGYRSDQMLISVAGETTIGDQDHTISPKLQEGKVRIILEWGPQPEDLDSHLVNPNQGIHVYYSVKEFSYQGRDNVTLDVDARYPMLPDRSNRVETTTIHQQLPGKYTFYIHDFSNQTNPDNHQMAESGARVTVLIGGDDGEKYVFEVPDKTGTLWEVFTLENGIITPSGAFTHHQDAGTVGQ